MNRPSKPELLTALRACARAVLDAVRAGHEGAANLVVRRDAAPCGGEVAQCRWVQGVRLLRPIDRHHRDVGMLFGKIEARRHASRCDSIRGTVQRLDEPWRRAV